MDFPNIIPLFSVIQKSRDLRVLFDMWIFFDHAKRFFLYGVRYLAIFV